MSTLLNSMDVDMLRRLVSERDFKTFFEQAAAEAAKLVGADGAALIEVQAGSTLQYRFFQGLPADHQKMAQGFTFEATHGTSGRVLHSGVPVFTADYPANPNAMPAFVASGLKANLVVPCGPPGQCSAVLAIAWFSHYPSQPPDEKALALIMLLADLMHAASYRQSLEHDLARQAQHDTLTGLPNRRYLTAYLEAALRISSCEPQGLAVAVLDLDDFKPVNDKHGHFAGDEVLRQLAERLNGALHPEDVVARLGGDEFVLVLKPVADLKTLRTFLKNLCLALDQPYTLSDGTRVECLSSIGVAVQTQHSDTPEELMRYADHALYIVKSRKASRTLPWAFYEREQDAARLPRRKTAGK